jgi:hypothetical protein
LILVGRRGSILKVLYSLKGESMILKKGKWYSHVNSFGEILIRGPISELVATKTDDWFEIEPPVIITKVLTLDKVTPLVGMRVRAYEDPTTWIIDAIGSSGAVLLSCDERVEAIAPKEFEWYYWVS